MAVFLNRKTRELRDDDGTGIAGADEIRNPDLSAVVGLPSWQWMIEGDAVRPPTIDELAALQSVLLADWKRSRIESIDARTKSIIDSGSVNINGVDISTSLANQVSLNMLKQVIDFGIATWPQPISATNGATYSIASLNDFKRISGLVATFVMTTKAEGRTLRSRVISAGTKEEIDAIIDDREVAGWPVVTS